MNTEGAEFTLKTCTENANESLSYNDMNEQTNVSRQTMVKAQSYANKLFSLTHNSRDTEGSSTKMDRELNDVLSAARANAFTYFDVPLSTHRSGLIGFTLLFVRRLLRKALRFMAKPYIEQNYHFQQSVLITLDTLAKHIKSLSNEKEPIAQWEAKKWTKE